MWGNQVRQKTGGGVILDGALPSSIGAIKEYQYEGVSYTFQKGFTISHSLKNPASLAVSYALSVEGRMVHTVDASLATELGLLFIFGGARFPLIDLIVEDLSRKIRRPLYGVRAREAVNFGDEYPRERLKYPIVAIGRPGERKTRNLDMEIGWQLDADYSICMVPLHTDLSRYTRFLLAC